MFLKINADDKNYEYVQDKPIIERPLAKRTAFKNNETQKVMKKENQINVTDDTNSNELQKDYEEQIAKQECIIKLMREQLKEKENTIEGLKKKYEHCEHDFLEQTGKCKQIMEENAKLEIVYKEREKTIQNLQKKFEKSIEENSKLSSELQEIKNTYFGPTDTTVNLTEAEKKTLQECVDFISINSLVPAKITLRNRGIEKKLRSINSIETESKNLYAKCEFIY